MIVGRCSAIVLKFLYFDMSFPRILFQWFDTFRVKGERLHYEGFRSAVIARFSRLQFFHSAVVTKHNDGFAALSLVQRLCDQTETSARHKDIFSIPLTLSLLRK